MLKLLYLSDDEFISIMLLKLILHVNFEIPLSKLLFLPICASVLSENIINKLNTRVQGI